MYGLYDSCVTSCIFVCRFIFLHFFPLFRDRAAKTFHVFVQYVPFNMISDYFPNPNSGPSSFSFHITYVHFDSISITVLIVSHPPLYYGHVYSTSFTFLYVYFVVLFIFSLKKKPRSNGKNCTFLFVQFVRQNYLIAFCARNLQHFDAGILCCFQIDFEYLKKW